MNSIRFFLACLFLPVLFTSCKKDTTMDPLSNVVFAKDGIIRIECADCQLNYTVLNDSKSFNIRDNQDIKFSYVSDIELKTTINVKKEQNIRLVVFDSYGRMISNELTELNEGAYKISSFKITLK